MFNRILSLMIVSVTAQAAAMLSGTADVSYLFPDGGFKLNLAGDGVFLNVSTTAPGLGMVGCTSNCDFGTLATVGGASAGSASWNGISSQHFQLLLREIGNSGDFTGSLTLYQPLSSTVMASAAIETFLMSATTTSNPPFFAETIFQFSAFPSADPTPEPATYGLVGFAIVTVGALKKHGGRATYEAVGRGKQPAC